MKPKYEIFVYRENGKRSYGVQLMWSWKSVLFDTVEEVFAYIRSFEPK